MLRVPLLQDAKFSDLHKQQQKRDAHIREILLERKYKQKKRKHAFFAMFFLTGTYCLLEFGVGIYSGSLALVSDGFHMLSDFLALIVGFCAVNYAAEDSTDASMTYGYARAEVLGALVNATGLLAICFTIMVEAVQRFFHQEEHVESVELVLWVGTAGLFINIAGMCIFGGGCCDHRSHQCSHEDAHTHTDIEHSKQKEYDPHNAWIHHSHSINSSYSCGGDLRTGPGGGDLRRGPQGQIVSYSDDDFHHGHSHSLSEKQNMNMHGVYLHLLGDALGSIVVIISASIMAYTDWEYKNYADPACSILIVWIITVSTWPLFIESANILAQRADVSIDVNRIRKSLATHPAVQNIHELHVWTLSGNTNVGSAHVMLDVDKLSKNADVLGEVQKIQDDLKQIFHEEGVHSSSIQLEFSYFGASGCTDKLCDDVRACLKRQFCLVKGVD